MKSITKLMVVTMLLAAALVVAPAAAARTIDTNGTTVYVGEANIKFDNGSIIQGNFTIPPGGKVTQLVHYSDPSAGAIDNTILADTNGNISELTRAAVGDKTGSYYVFAGGDTSDRNAAAGYINIQYPTVALDVVLNTSHQDSVAGKSVTRDTVLDFKLSDNIIIPNAKINIEVTMPGGGTTTEFGGQRLKDIEPDGSVKYIGGIDLSTAEAGTYTAIAKWPSTSDFYGKGFDSNTVTFEVSTKKLTITSDKDSVVRGNSFSVTVTGESQKLYLLFVKEVGSLGNDQYPLIAPGQNGVTNDTAAWYGANKPALSSSILNTIPGLDNTQAWVKTTAGGTRTVQFNTTTSTDNRQFTIRVQDLYDNSTYDEVKVKVEKGAVTITAAGTGTYYIGEEITLEGTCTDSDTVYLFLTGPNLGTNGVKLTDPSIRTDTLDPTTFDREPVEADDTWSFKWNTADLGRSLDSGGYTIYAASKNVSKEDLSDAEYDTISIQLRSGFISATSSGATVAKGDDLVISGTAQGNPESVRIWIFGKNYYGSRDGGLGYIDATVESDGTFEDDSLDTSHLASGQYFVVVQHPMAGGFGVKADTANGVIYGDSITNATLTNLQASDAANALIKALDSPNIDDTYVKLVFVVEEPRILIDPIGDVPAGSTFTISGTTNLAVGDTLTVEVTSAAFTPTEKGEGSGFASVARTTEVKAGDGANVWSVEIDGSNFKPDQYIVKVECIETDTTATANFNVIEAVPTTPTVTPTEEVTPTETVPTTPTVPPTETETPGFGALLALAGLGAVAYLVLRRD